ncbi:MAG: SOS response-associated peptidase [Pseudomonadota bacterium]
MCGRYTNHLSWTEIVELYELTDPGPAQNLPVRLNIAPTQDVPFVAVEEEKRVLKSGRWWLVPHWAKEMPKYALFNARSEEAAQKPAFRDAFKHRRCLIPATGYYEWTKGEDGGKDPHHIHLPDGEPFSFAGLWARNDMLEVTSCTILTAAAAPEIAHLHHRMPIILDRSAYADWLDPTAERAALTNTLKMHLGASLQSTQVTRAINSSRYTPDKIEPAGGG